MSSQSTVVRFIAKTFKLPKWLLSLALVFIVSVGCSNATKADLPKSIRLDYAYYNPVSLVLKEKGWVESEFAKDKIQVEWVLSQGSNKALEFLNARSLDFGSTAGASALIGKANGNPIKSIYTYSKPEWVALVTKGKSSIKSVSDLKGKKVAATRGTDAFIFLLRSLDQVGLSDKDVTIIPLQHADGRAALEKGDVDAWAGLDPHMAKAELESGARLFSRNPEFNSYGVLNVREEFAQRYPQLVERVLRIYEQGRQWAQENPEELKAVLVKESKLSPAVAAKQLERTDLSNSAIGGQQKNAIVAAGSVLKKSGIISESVNVNQVVDSLIDPQYIDQIVKK